MMFVQQPLSRDEATDSTGNPTLPAPRPRRAALVVAIVAAAALALTAAGLGGKLAVADSKATSVLESLHRSHVSAGPWANFLGDRDPKDLPGGIVMNTKELYAPCSGECPLSGMERDKVYYVYNHKAPGYTGGCARNAEPWAFRVVKGDKDKVLFFFQGGGACWNEKSWTCDAKEGSACTASTCTKTCQEQNYKGIMNRANPDNIYKAYTIVEPLYCTGDVFAGNNVVTWKAHKEGADEEVRLNGYNNTRVVVHWLKQQFSSGDLSSTLASFVLTGSSAGGLGVMWWSRPFLTELREHYDPLRTLVMVDSFAAATRDPTLAFKTLYSTYNMCAQREVVSAEKAAACASGALTIQTVWGQTMADFPEVLFAYVGSADDPVQIMFAMDFEPTPEFFRENVFYSLVNKILMDWATHPNFVSWIRKDQRFCNIWMLMLGVPCLLKEVGRHTFLQVGWLYGEPDVGIDDWDASNFGGLVGKASLDALEAPDVVAPCTPPVRGELLKDWLAGITPPSRKASSMCYGQRVPPANWLTDYNPPKESTFDGVGNAENGGPIFEYCPEGVDNSVGGAPSGSRTCVQTAALMHDTNTLVPDEGGGGVECFPGDATVLVEGHGPLPLRKLVVGDRVAVAAGVFEPVLGFLHARPGASRSVRVRHAHGELRASPLHLVFLAGGGARRASASAARAGELRAGDVLRVLLPTGQMVPSAVLSTDLVRTGTGMFAPLTPSGKVVVDGVLASTYADAAGMRLPHAAMHTAFFPVRLCHAAGLCGRSSRRPGELGAEEMDVWAKFLLSNFGPLLTSP